MPVRVRLVPILLAIVVGAVAVAVPTQAPVRAAGPKVAIIVGPVGTLTSGYRSRSSSYAPPGS